MFKKEPLYKDVDLAKRIDFARCLPTTEADPFKLLEMYASTRERRYADGWDARFLFTPTPPAQCSRLLEEYKKSGYGVFDEKIDYYRFEWIMRIYNELLWEFNMPMQEAISIAPVKYLYDKFHPWHEAGVHHIAEKLYHKDHFVFFHKLTDENPWCSNWYPCTFQENGIVFSSTEQYLMYKKALLFNDDLTAATIVETEDPGAIKKLGRQVKGYVDSKWSALRYSVCLEANRLKFSQNPDLLKLLIETRGQFAECSPTDKIWGIGIGITDPRRFEQEKWPGTNYLGKVLNQLRSDLQ